MSRWCSNQLSYAPAIGHLFSLRIILATRLKWKREFEFFGWFPSSGLGTLILQAPAWPFFGKLELQKPHSQAGAWERATQQLSAKVTHVGRQQLPLGQNRRDKDTRIHQASKLIGVCRRGWQVSFHGGPSFVVCPAVVFCIAHENFSFDDVVTIAHRIRLTRSPTR